MSQETNPGADAPKSEQPEQPKPAEAKAKAFDNVPILPKSMRPVEAPKPVESEPKLVNPLMGETDIYLKLTMAMEGRTESFLPITVVKTVYDGLSRQSRGLLHLALTSLLEEMKGAASLKLNSQLGYELPDAGKNDKNGGRTEQKESIPPYTANEDEPEDSPLHTPPGVDPGQN
jgi:hypothetical protein